MSAPLTARTADRPQPAEVFPVFQHLLTSPIVTALVSATGKRLYRRLFLPIVILWGFIYQRLNPDHSCDAVVSYFAAGGADQLRPGLSQQMSDNTAGYCKARARLPLRIIQGVLRHTVKVIQAEIGSAGLWHGRRVTLLYGSTLQLAAEDELVEHYGRPHNQHGASHWPLLRLVAGFDLFSGAVVWPVDAHPLIRSRSVC